VVEALEGLGAELRPELLVEELAVVRAEGLGLDGEIEPRRRVERGLPHRLGITLGMRVESTGP
jgi:hypothetical protein